MHVAAQEANPARKSQPGVTCTSFPEPPSSVGISVGTGSYEGVGVGVGWWGGGTGVSTGEPVVRYPEVRVPLQ